MLFEELNEYRKDVKKLSKKYKTIADDVNVIKKVLVIKPDERPPFSFKIDGIGLKTGVIKVRKIASKSFKGRGVNSGFRLVYAYFQEEERIIFIELYHKSNKFKEDKQRIIKYFE